MKRKGRRLAEPGDLVGAADRIAPSEAGRETPAAKRRRLKRRAKAQNLPLKNEPGKLGREFRRAEELLDSDPATTARICEWIMAQEDGPSDPTPRRLGKRIAEVRELHGKAQEALRKAAPPAPSQRKPARSGVDQASSARNRVGAELGLQEWKEFEKRHRTAKGLATRDPEQAISLCESTLQRLEGRSGTKTLRDLFLRVRAEALIHHRRARR